MTSKVQQDVGRIVGAPKMWAAEPVAAGALVVTNVGGFNMPAAAAAGKVGTVAARAGASTVRLGTRLDGAIPSAVAVNVGDVLARTGNILTGLGLGRRCSVASRAELAGVLETFEQTRVARHESHPPVGFGERISAWGVQAEQLPARVTEEMQHLGDRLGMIGGGLLPAFADGVPGGGHRFDIRTPQSMFPNSCVLGLAARLSRRFTETSFLMRPSGLPRILATPRAPLGAVRDETRTNQPGRRGSCQRARRRIGSKREPPGQPRWARRRSRTAEGRHA